jgi:serine/threonine protein kinase
MQYTLSVVCERYISESWLECQRKLGAGSFGKVYEGIYRGSQKVAYKVTRRQLSPDAIRETNILKTLHHPSIVRYIDVIHTSQHTLLVMELIDGGTLYNYIESNYRSSDYWYACENMMIDVAYAMSYLHEKNIVHADLKSDNVLLRRNGKAVLSDFGLSTIIENSEAEVGDSNTGMSSNNYC